MRRTLGWLLCFLAAATFLRSNASPVAMLDEADHLGDVLYNGEDGRTSRKSGAGGRVSRALPSCEKMLREKNSRLGENAFVGVGRRAAILEAAPSIVVESGSNRAGNDEALEMDLSLGESAGTTSHGINEKKWTVYGYDANCDKPVCKNTYPESEVKGGWESQHAAAAKEYTVAATYKVDIMSGKATTVATVEGSLGKKSRSFPTTADPKKKCLRICARIPSEGAFVMDALHKVVDGSALTRAQDDARAVGRRARSSSSAYRQRRVQHAGNNEEALSLGESHGKSNSAEHRKRKSKSAEHRKLIREQRRGFRSQAREANAVKEGICENTDAYKADRKAATRM